MQACSTIELARPGLARRRLAAALAGAAVLHVALAAAVSGGDTAGSSGLRAHSPTVTSIQLRTVADVISTPLLVAPSASEDLQSADTREPASPDAPIEPGQRYFDTSEVNEPAMPLPEWNVDVPMLMGQGVRSVSVDVLISETGVAQQCAVTRIEPQQAPALQLSVASRLCETMLRPAQRRGVAVASVRHIELVLAAD